MSGECQNTRVLKDSMDAYSVNLFIFAAYLSPYLFIDLTDITKPMYRYFLFGL